MERQWNIILLDNNTSSYLWTWYHVPSIVTRLNSFNAQNKVVCIIIASYRKANRCRKVNDLPKVTLLIVSHHVQDAVRRGGGPLPEEARKSSKRKMAFQVSL